MAEESGPWAEMRLKDEQIAQCNIKAQSSSNKQRLGGGGFLSQFYLLPSLYSVTAGV